MQDLRREVKDGARDPHLVHDQYEDYWAGVLNHARSIVAAEPGSLARAVNLCLAAHAERPRKVRWMRGRRMAAIVAGRPLPPLLSARCIDTITRVAIADLVAGYCNADTRRIIELGSGWGVNLFYLWLSGAPRAAEYVAMEYTATGREVTQLLASTEPGLALTTRPFDYHQPDLSEFRTDERTIVFTSYSIEQITYLSDALFEELLAIPGLDRVVHVEPVSWQLMADSVFDSLIRPLSYVVPPCLSLEIDIRRRSRASGYNKDLITRLRKLERSGRVRIENVAKNYVGPNPINPATAIIWRRA
jgi:hypothetical protein